MINKKKKCNYLYSEEFKVNKNNISEEDLKIIFNKKYFNTIIKIEKYILKN